MNCTRRITRRLARRVEYHRQRCVWFSGWALWTTDPKERARLLRKARGPLWLRALVWAARLWLSRNGA